MATKVPVKLPQMGESVAEATIVEWLKDVGDTVSIDELFVTIGTDKVESELPSAFDGVLIEKCVQEGETCNIGSDIAFFEVEDSVAKEILATYEKDKELEFDHKMKTSKESSTNTLLENDTDKFLSPVVRKIAAKHGLSLDDLSNIQPTGSNNRLTKNDLLNFLNKDNISSVFQAKKINLDVEPGDKLTRLSRRQTFLANHLQTSFNEIPHVTTFKEIDVTTIFEFRNKIKNEFLSKHETKITFSHFFQYSVIQALKKFPLLNSWMNMDELLLKNNQNIGFAASLDNGDLVVPNVKGAQHLSFIEWIIAINNKASQAKSNHLVPEDIQKTTFTISNTGVFGSTSGTPIVSRPQVGVLALGKIVSKPGVFKIDNEEKIGVRKIMIASLSYDHRVINGAYASQFLTEFATFLKPENFTIE